MTVKRRDFQKIATTIHQFLLKLTDTYECAELRDSLNMSLLQLQKYYRRCQQRLQHTGRHNDQNGTGYVSPRQSLRITLSRSSEALSPMTPYIEEPQYFHAHWTVLDEKSDQIRKSFSQENFSPGRSINTPPVHYAATKGDFELLNELLLQKKDVLEDQDCLGRTPLMYAVYYDKIEVVRWLLKRGADPNSCDLSEITSLHWACFKGYVALIELLLDAGANINTQDSFGRSACHWACTYNTVEPLQLLIEFETKVNQHDRNGLTPAMWACRLDHLSHLNVLANVKNQEIDHIDGFERDRNGRTIVHWSIRRQLPLECLKYLVNEHTVQLKDDEGKTVLLLAAEQGALETCKVIIEKFGSKYIEDVDDQDRTSLILATNGGHGEVVNFLLENGANIKFKDRNGASCVDIARNQYLFYCQLIISSHIREMERRQESIPSDCVELIEKKIKFKKNTAPSLKVLSNIASSLQTKKANSRHNSISEARQQVKTPPRPPVSPKSPSSQSSKSPTIKRLPIKYARTKNIDNDETPNGFDAMSSDPYQYPFNDLGTKTDSNDNDIGNHHENPLNSTELSRTLENFQYQRPQTLDVLDNETGQQYHRSYEHLHSNMSADNSRSDNLENKLPSSIQIETHKPIQRAKKVNRINGNNVNKPHFTPPELHPFTSETSENSQSVPAVNSPVKHIRSNSHQLSIMEISQKVNYGASLEPINKIHSNETPVRKKKKKSKDQRILAKSQDRLGNLNFDQDQNSKSLGTMQHARSLENMPNKVKQLPNGIISNRNSSFSETFPSPYGEQSINGNRQNSLLFDDRQRFEQEALTDKPNGKNLSSFEIRSSNWLKNGISQF